MYVSCSVYVWLFVAVFVQCPLHTGEEDHSCKVEDIQAAQNVDYDKVGIDRPRVTSQTGGSYRSVCSSTTSPNGRSQCVPVYDVTMHLFRELF